MSGQITTFEASKKYKLSTGYLRRMMLAKRITGRLARVGDARTVWLIDEVSLKKYIATKPAPGRPKAAKA